MRLFFIKFLGVEDGGREGGFLGFILGRGSCVCGEIKNYTCSFYAPGSSAISVPLRV